MEKLGFGLDDDSAFYDFAKQSNSQKSQLSIQQGIKDLGHACRCTDANCGLHDCKELKRLIQHTKSCKVMIKGGCSFCRHLLAISFHHAKHCKEAECPIIYCSMFRDRIKGYLHNAEVQILKMHCGIDVLQTKSGNSNSSNQPSPGAQPHSSPHPPQPDTGMKPSTGPPVGALQAVQPVQAAAAGQTDLHMVAASVNYGNGNPVVSPPIPSTRFMPAIQQMERQMQMLNMGNVACWEGSGQAQNPLSHLQSMVCAPNSCSVSTSSTLPTTNSKNSK